MEQYFGEKTPKLGFGLMRLPKFPSGKMDMEQVKKMVDLFMEAGLTYFDTAYIYDGGDSERAAKEALVDRYPRESFTLATKLCAWMGAHNEKTAKQQFYTSLERTGAGYFDYYLLHALQAGNYKTYDKYHLWDFVKEQKAKGLIKHWGFSFHATPDILDEILTVHPDAGFVQLQLNYADWENPDVTARENYEVARKHGKSIIVMEPVKGGALANPTTAVQEILRGADREASFASWAIRYAASLEGIITVLSGMSNIPQMQDNLSYMKEFKPLNEQEQAAVRKAQAPVEAILKVDLYGTAVLLEEVGKIIKEGGAGVTISSQSGHRMPVLTLEQDELLATNAHGGTASLEMLQPGNIKDTLHAYQMAKRCNEKRVMAEAVRWGERGAKLKERIADYET